MRKAVHPEVVRHLRFEEKAGQLDFGAQQAFRRGAGPSSTRAGSPRAAASAARSWSSRTSEAANFRANVVLPVAFAPVTNTPQCVASRDATEDSAILGRKAGNCEPVPESGKGSYSRE